MAVTIDSSTVISLAWAGLLRLLADAPFTVTVPKIVHEETVDHAVAAGHADAIAIRAAIGSLPLVTGLKQDPADGQVLAAAYRTGTLLSDDATLGRRAVNTGVTWLRTADMVVLYAQLGLLDLRGARGALEALCAAGRITSDLLSYSLEELS
ncbi:MAG: hypothetical protein H0T98_11130 [Euzebyaceae bacterium]|jgi:hypothetical protein|nr:hypothetical protein [Euzebyaceae bacterium]